MILILMFKIQPGVSLVQSKESEFVHLDRDDRGLLNDTIMVNGEEIQNP